MLIVNFVDIKDYFVSHELLKDLSTSSLDTKIKKQMSDTSLARSVATVTSATKVVMQGSILTTVALNIVFQGALSLIFGMINSLQLVLHIPIMRIVLPGNLMTLFSVLIPIVMFDVLEDLGLLVDIFPDVEYSGETSILD